MNVCVVREIARGAAAKPGGANSKARRYLERQTTKTAFNLKRQAMHESAALAACFHA
jgi:hypothetical protein